MQPSLAHPPVGPTPALECRPFAGRCDPPDQDSVRRAFLGTTPCVLGQAWLSRPEPAFSPGQVRIAWQEGRLFVFAELTDADVFTRATDSGQRLWELGDAFEMFLCPEGSGGYVELQVSPANHRLALRFSQAGDLDRLRATGELDHVLLPTDSFRSRTWTVSEPAGWSVLAEIPVATVGGSAATGVGARWRFSFCRVDCTRGSSTPVLSSTSPHLAVDFHRQAEWGALILGAEP